MSDPTMISTLAAQIRCIWPQEQQFLRRYNTPQKILDVGCGTGEFIERLAKFYPHAQIIGIDIEPEHVARAREKCAVYGERIRIQKGDAYALSVPENSVDLVICRHVLQAVPQPRKIIRECYTSLRKDGWLHLLVEDYTMIHISGPPEFDQFWLDGPVKFGLDTECDLRIGRHALSLLDKFTDKRVDYVVVDTQRVPPDDLAAIFESWRDGYSEVLSQYLKCSPREVASRMTKMIESIRKEYAVWQVPIVSGRKA